MSGQRKIVLFIAEGSSDAKALSLPLGALFVEKGLSAKARCEVYGTDPLLHRLQDKNNPTFESPFSVTDRIKDAVDDFLNSEAGGVFEAGDIACVAVLCDLDACFCDNACIKHRPDEPVTYDIANKTVYCQNIPYIVGRNDTKRDAFGVLVSERVIQIETGKAAIPLGVFYMNLNLEHALYNETDITDSNIKENKAAIFRSRYRNDPKGFELLLEDLQQIGEGYEGSHDDASLKAHSFDRVSNLATIIDWISKNVKL